MEDKLILGAGLLLILFINTGYLIYLSRKSASWLEKIDRFDEKIKKLEKGLEDTDVELQVISNELSFLSRSLKSSGRKG